MFRISLRPRRRPGSRLLVLPALVSAAVVLGGLSVAGTPASAQVRSPAAPAAVKAVLMRQTCTIMGTDRQSTDPIYNMAVHCAKLWLIPGSVPTFYAQNEVYCRHVNGSRVTFPACAAITTQAQLAWKIGSGRTTVHGSGIGRCEGTAVSTRCPASAVFHATTPVRFRPFSQQVWAVSHDLVALPESHKIVGPVNVATPHVTAKDLG